MSSDQQGGSAMPFKLKPTSTERLSMWIQAENEQRLSAAAEAAGAAVQVQQLPPEAVVRSIAMGTILVDVREPEDLQSGTLPDALSIPLSSLRDAISEIIINRAAPIACFCRSGQRSSVAAAVLQELGYSEVRSISGGLEALQRLPGGIQMAQPWRPKSNGVARPIGHLEAAPVPAASLR